LQYHIAGRLHVVMDDGDEAEFGPGEVSALPPGHDAWVVGDEPVVVVDISGMLNYAKG
ncbi:MAG TPA: cupin, partial [Planctomycetota bacterium]|nr:cupin [Planctomycetota bacterium]